MMSVLFNTLSGFVIAFLPRGRHLLISWAQSPSAVILDMMCNDMKIFAWQKDYSYTY